MNDEELDLIYGHCRVEGCNKKAVRHLICGMHQSRWKRNQSYDAKRTAKTKQELNDKKNSTAIIRKEKYLKQNLGRQEIICAKCKLIKSIDKFYAHSLKQKSCWCIECFRRHSRMSDLKLKFGITPEQYNELLESQNYCCAICNEKENVIHARTKEVIKLAVDHCHKTKKIRGLLCNRCNFGIGYFKDSIELLRNAIKYLEK